jgi:alkylhydroperoxidase/carboxymuconolactone decarboxylase family protein YurZ
MSDCVELLVSQPRPPVEHLQAVSGASFPSGHATQASAFCDSCSFTRTANRKGPKMPEGSSETPVLDTLVAMTAESVARCGLDAKSLITARIAALVAVDAPAASYLMHVGPAADAGVTVEQVQDILIAVAPIVGTPRTVSAAAKITQALGIVIVALEAELEAEAAEEQ